jgi:hypothetical protein
MYKDHPVYIDPEDSSSRLWRYTDFTKFISLIQRKELYFLSIDKLGDRFEGTFPRREVGHHKRSGYWGQLSKGFTAIRKNIFVSCWHYNQNESAGMWKLYSQAGKGIAIQTTIPRFKESFKCCESSIYIGKVIYINYDTDTFYTGESKKYKAMNLGVPYIHKRNIFADEREYRAIHISNHHDPLSQPYFPVDLDVLIESIVVAPESEDWFVDLTEKLLNQFLPGKKVIRSIHDQEPFS